MAMQPRDRVYPDHVRRAAPSLGDGAKYYPPQAVGRTRRGSVINRQMVAARLRQFRERLALSQAEFGQMFGDYGQRQISFYERGKFMRP